MSAALTFYDAIKVVSMLAEKIIVATVELRHNRWGCYASCKQVCPSLDNESTFQKKMLCKNNKQCMNRLMVVIVLLACILTIELIGLMVVLADLI